MLHRVAVGTRTLLVVELEASTGPRPFSFPNTYQAVREAVERLNTTHSLPELYDVAAREAVCLARAVHSRYSSLAFSWAMRRRDVSSVVVRMSDSWGASRSHCGYALV